MAACCNKSNSNGTPIQQQCGDITCCKEPDSVGNANATAYQALWTTSACTWLPPRTQ